MYTCFMPPGRAGVNRISMARAYHTGIWLATIIHAWAVHPCTPASLHPCILHPCILKPASYLVPTNNLRILSQNLHSCILKPAYSTPPIFYYRKGGEGGAVSSGRILRSYGVEREGVSVLLLSPSTNILTTHHHDIRHTTTNPTLDLRLQLHGLGSLIQQWPITNNHTHYEIPNTSIHR